MPNMDGTGPHGNDPSPFCPNLIDNIPDNKDEVSEDVEVSIFIKRGVGRANRRGRKFTF